MVVRYISLMLLRVLWNRRQERVYNKMIRWWFVRLFVRILQKRYGWLLRVWLL